MRIAMYGVTGNLGPIFAGEALNRGHSVTAIVRDPARMKLSHKNLSVMTGDVTDPASVAKAVAGHDVVIASITGRRDGNHQVVLQAAHTLLEALPRAGIKRLLWVGGTSSLEVKPGVTFLESPEYPAPASLEPATAFEVYKTFKGSSGGVEWSFFSPARGITRGERTGRYRTGVDAVLRDAEGTFSKFTWEDYAVALVDELEHPKHTRQRWTAAY